MYQLRQPAAALRPYVEHYWFVTPDDGPVDIRVDVFVDGRADLIFNYGAPYLREVIGGTQETHTFSNLDAQRLVPIRITQHGDVRIVGVRFWLGGLAPFSTVPLAGVTGRTPPPAAVLGAAAAHLESALAAESNLDVQARLLDEFFLGRLAESGSFDRFSTALGVLIASDGAASVDHIANRTAVSARQVDRLFARFLGIPPKTVGRILRFQRALRGLMQDPRCSLADVAANAGYFDHAHFIRDFKRMSGGLPRGYRGYYPATSPTDFAPNVVVFVQDRDPRAK